MRSIRRFAAWTTILALGLFLSVTVVVDPVFATDDDFDGLSAELEAALGTSDQNANTDGDGWGDFSEVYEHGTDPTLTDSDGDTYEDSVDPDPLLAAGGEGGATSPSFAYDTNLAHAAPVGTTPFEGRGVNAMSGELETVLYTVDLGPGLMGQNVLELRYLSGIDFNGPWGRNIVANWDDWLVVQEDDDVEVFKDGRRFFFDEDSGAYTAPAGFPYTLTLDAQAGEYVLTAIRGGREWHFDDTTGLLASIEDRFANALTVNRDQYGVITSFDLPEGNSVTVSAYASGRYSGLTDWSQSGRSWALVYNCRDELARAADPEFAETQFFWLNGSDDEDLNANLVRMLLPMGQTAMAMEYDESDRVTKQTIGWDVATFSYTPTATTVTDAVGNERVWNHTAGEVVPTLLVAYSNRDVRQGDPASWTTTFRHDSNLMCVKIVHPEGNRTDLEWTGYCLTERRDKATDTETDDNDEDLVSTFTYGSTYHELADSTDPEGNVTERSLNGLEQVTWIGYETITHTDPDVTITESFTFNADGTPCTHTDGEGAVTRFDYFTSGVKTGLLWKVTRDYGVGTLNLVTEYDYSEYRYLVEETDPDGNTWTYQTDALGRRTLSIAPSPFNYQTAWTYNQNGWLTQKDVENVDKDNYQDTGNAWWTNTFDHDDLGRVVMVTEEITSSSDRITSRAYDGNGNVILVTLPEGNKVRQVFDERGLLAERTRGYNSAAASTESFVYDGNRNLTTYTNGRSKTSSLSYDDFGRKVGEESPLGHYASFTLDKCGRVTETRRYNSADVLLAAGNSFYDEVGRVWATDEWLDEDSDAAIDEGEWIRTEYAHDDCGRVVVVTDPLSNDTTFSYDAVGRKTGQEDALGNQTQWDYTDDYRVPCEISEIEQVPGGGTETFVTEIETDTLHRVTERRVVDRLNSANKHVFKTKYTSLGVAVEEEDALGNKTYAWHDGLGRITHTCRDLGSSEAIDTYYGFDDNGNQVTLTDDSSHVTTWSYNARDLVASITYHDTAARTFSWNADDTLAGWTDENGTEVTNAYDDDGRLTARDIDRAVGVLGPTEEAYSYDGLGRLTQGTNDNSTVQRTYDTLSRLLTETQGPNPLGQSGKTISYTYDDGGNRATCEYFSGYDLVYTPDACGRWTLIEDAQSNDLVTWQFYGPGGRVKRAVHLNGTSENLGYDGYRFVTDVDHKDSQEATFAGFDYGYDAMGNPLYEERTHQSGAGDCYAYDKAYRLTAVLVGSSDPSAECSDSDWDDYSHTKLIEYQLDDVSNRTSVDTTPYQGQTTYASYTTNSVNEYTVVDTVNRTHDANGNLTVAGSTSMAFDYRNNLTKVEQSQVTLGEYEYDVFNRRTVKYCTEAHFYYDHFDIVEIYGAGDVRLQRIVHSQGIDHPAVLNVMDENDLNENEDTSEYLDYYYGFDMIGSVVCLTDSDGEVVESVQYDVYGEPSFFGSDGNPIGSSLVLNQFLGQGRYYDEETGLYWNRFRTYDPYTGRFLQRDPLGCVDGPNLFQYAVGRPTIAVDPLGLDVLDDAIDDFERRLEEAGALEAREKGAFGSGESALGRVARGYQADAGDWARKLGMIPLGFFDDILGLGLVSPTEAKPADPPEPTGESSPVKEKKSEGDKPVVEPGVDIEGLGAWLKDMRNGNISNVPLKAVLGLDVRPADGVKVKIEARVDKDGNVEIHLEGRIKLGDVQGRPLNLKIGANYNPQTGAWEGSVGVKFFF